VDQRASEASWLDFKNKSDRDPDNVKNLSVALSAFGNTEGGVIVWGVDARSTKADPADVARELRPFPAPGDFVARLNEVTSGATIPVLPGVRHDVIASTNELGYVVTYIPMSPDAPHLASHDHRYYLRAGSSCARMPRAILAAMFGRRPTPAVCIAIGVLALEPHDPYVVLTVSLGIANVGIVPAGDPYVVIDRIQEPGESSSIRFRWKARRDRPFAFNDFSQHGIGVVGASAIAQDTKLPPGDVRSAMSVQFLLAAPFVRPAIVSGLTGTGDSVPERFTLELQHEELERLVAAQHHGRRWNGEDAARTARDVFGDGTLRGGVYRNASLRAPV
jgi:hypothetical protein